MSVGGIPSRGNSAWFAGLMSGTSLDGVDAVLARFDDDSAGCRIAELRHHHQPFPPPLRAALLELQRPREDDLAHAALAANALSEHYAATLASLMTRSDVAAPDVTAIGAHGQTVRHRPEDGYTIQLLNGALLAERSGIAVVCDFRGGDVAAGGQGAPLVPAFHAALFGGSTARVVVNIGGMANITVLDPSQPVTGFDCGPGNVLLDAWIAHRRGESLDRDGAWAASGTVLPGLLETLLAHPFFARTPPKSCGREAFDLAWLQSLPLDGLAPADVQATLAELTARSIATDIARHAPGAREVLLCGGGALNSHLVARLRAALPGHDVTSTATLGLDPMHVEAAAFAWLARQRLAHAVGNLPAVTGARGFRVLGALYAAP